MPNEPAAASARAGRQQPRSANLSRAATIDADPLREAQALMKSLLQIRRQVRLGHDFHRRIHDRRDLLVLDDLRQVLDG
jgi:hypothetical protein